MLVVLNPAVRRPVRMETHSPAGSFRACGASFLPSSAVMKHGAKVRDFFAKWVLTNALNFAIIRKRPKGDCGPVTVTLPDVLV